MRYDSRRLLWVLICVLAAQSQVHGGEVTHEYILGRILYGNWPNDDYAVGMPYRIKDIKNVSQLRAADLIRKALTDDERAANIPKCAAAILHFRCFQVSRYFKEYHENWYYSYEPHPFYFVMPRYDKIAESFRWMARLGADDVETATYGKREVPELIDRILSDTEFTTASERVRVRAIQLSLEALWYLRAEEELTRVQKYTQETLKEIQQQQQEKKSLDDFQIDFLTLQPGFYLGTATRLIRSLRIRKQIEKAPKNKLLQTMVSAMIKYEWQPPQVEGIWVMDNLLLESDIEKRADVIRSAAAELVAQSETAKKTKRINEWRDFILKRSECKLSDDKRQLNKSLRK